MQSRHLLLLFTVSAIIIAGCSSAPATGGGGASGTTSTAAGGGGASTGSTGTTGTTTTTSGGGGGASTTSSGTGAGGSSGADYSCSVSSAITAYCILYEGLTSEEMTSDMEGCAALAGMNGTSCPSANALGTCMESALGVTTITTYYSGTQTTASEAMITCEGMGGTWTAS